MNEVTTELLQRTNTEPWYAGMKNLLRRELYLERSKMYWIQQLMIWTLLSNGVAILIFAIPAGLLEGAGAIEYIALGAFFNALVFLFVIFIPVMLQDIIIDEKLSGTTAWILSKPVSKKLYLLSKLVASVFAIAGVSVGIQGIIALCIFSLLGYTIPLSGFILNLGLTVITIAYFASMIVMLGTMTVSRGKVLAAALGIGLGSQIMANFLPWILYVIPYSLPLLGMGLIMGVPLTGLDIMLFSAATQIILFIIVALFVFDRTEL
jgi:ABC-2 type transport system permease protein